MRSFRDPAGSVVRSGGRILRAVEPASTKELEAFLDTASARKATEQGKLVRSVRIPSSEIPSADSGAHCYEHERIAFPSYPHEWPAEMFAAAGDLTLELFQNALHDGFGLKDATPYNVLYRGSAPVFVDILSFERRDPRDASWMAYAQFVRTFLLPLLAHRHFGMEPGEVFAQKRDGLEPDALYRMAGLGKRLSPDFLSLVTLPKWMSGKATADVYHPAHLDSAEKAKFILTGLLERTAKQLRSLSRTSGPESTWSGYLDHKSLYNSTQLAQKETFVQEALELAHARTVLDVGANEGRFSLLAAERGASVVAIDTDPAVVGTIWREASRRGADVLPLVVDLTRPTPAMGWRNQECDSFLDRVQTMGRFDMVMMLAVIHHMLVSERIPLAELMGLVAEISNDFALIEFVAPADPMFSRIVRGREALHRDLTTASFESAAAPTFEIVRCQKIDGLQRWLYLLRKRA
ncbi:MAG: class I SAM-dependent methyltransferase [Bryobacteraceae bacterium]